MSFAHNPLANAEDAERLLGSLAGVVSAHVVADATGDIVEIHVLSAADLHPKQMVRNVESALSAGLGLQIDRRIVSVAQIRADVESNGGTRAATTDGSSHQPDPHPGTPDTTDEARHDVPYTDEETPRLEFVRYESRRDTERSTCTVVLRAGHEQVTGSGAGPDTTLGRAEAAATAVFHGIRQARPDLHVALEAAVISNSHGSDYVIVVAHAVLDRTTTPLAGAAPLTRSPEEAAILAALQATNRWSA